MLYEGLSSLHCSPGRSNLTVEVHQGYSLVFLTQRTGRGPMEDNVDCSVDYRLVTCTEVKVRCQVSMEGSGPDCREGDRASLYHGAGRAVQ